ncbi:MAG: hypothetical protein OXE78_10520 [Gammaproteobacteria bacterium]|nr:hypothetical protein [Gammaproteobacteria bacterium]
MDTPACHSRETQGYRTWRLRQGYAGEGSREAAYENRRVARRGCDPLAEKRQAKVPLFRNAARQTCLTLRPK